MSLDFCAYFMLSSESLGISDEPCSQLPRIRRLRHPKYPNKLNRQTNCNRSQNVNYVYMHTVPAHIIMHNVSYVYIYIYIIKYIYALYSLYIICTLIRLKELVLTGNRGQL